MPEESIAGYLNSINSILIFIAIIALIYLIIFFISRIIIRRVKKQNPEACSQDETFKPASIKSYIRLNKDIYREKNIFIFSIFFIFSLLSIFIITFAISIINQFQANMEIFLWIGLVFLSLAATVYIIKSKIIN